MAYLYLITGKNVVISGLDQDFRGEPFAPMDISNESRCRNCHIVIREF